MGDVPDHSYAIVQGKCAATSSTNGEKTGAFTEFQEVWKGSSKNHGQFNVTMDNGDITYYTYERSGPNSDVKSPASNKWNISGGTGKHKDMKKDLEARRNRHDDGSSDWLCTGPRNGTTLGCRRRYGWGSVCSWNVGYFS